MVGKFFQEFFILLIKGERGCRLELFMRGCFVLRNLAYPLWPCFPTSLSKGGSLSCDYYITNFMHINYNHPNNQKDNKECQQNIARQQLRLSLNTLKGTVLHRTVSRDRVSGKPIRTYAERFHIEPFQSPM